MALNSTNRKDSTLTVRVACAVLFCTFSYCWLYYFQSDLLALLQHVLSNGQTHYSRMVGALLITALLQLLALIVAAVVRLYRRTHALCYLPSVLLLTILSDVGASFASHPSFGHWLWTAPLVLVVWGAAVWLSRQLMPFGVSRVAAGIFSRRMWINMLIMALMFLSAALLSETGAVFHYRMHAETALLQNQPDEALRVGSRSHETDVHLTMLRAHALYRQGLLGERLFQYPVKGSGADLLPLKDSRSRLLLLPADSVWYHLGVRPAHPMTFSRFMASARALHADSLFVRNKSLADYQLCALLVDRKLDAFAALLPTYYAIDDALPRHYKEALILYTHQRRTPVVVYHDAVLDEDWDDLQQLEHSTDGRNDRKLKVLDKYQGTYWYYYFYGS